MVRLSMVCPYPHGLRLSVISSLMYSTRYSDFIGYEIRDKHRMKNKIVEEEDWEAEPELEKVQEEQPITMTQ